MCNVFNIKYEKITFYSLEKIKNKKKIKQNKTKK